MANGQNAVGLRLSGPLINFITIVLGIAAGYFLTIQSLKIELAAKAEAAVVGTLDKKLAGFEVILKQGVVNKEEFYRFSRDVEARLTRIEFYVTDKPGGQIGEK
ncbi:MAG: hypothetical protein KAW91_06205 [candidate division Zixibacteria bacterium]|nr:hypothetical protein [candidate division Zixibacteria bacterium]MCK4607689.1 hypothetical protein [candidate division Zixibacteria bacterium]